MTAQFFDDRFDLVRNFPLKFLILRIGRAAHGEVLPDQNAVTVAEVEKCVILVHTAAPAAHHVAVGFPQKRKRLIQPLGVAGMEGVQRHPVRPADVGLFAVDKEAELPASLRISRIRADQAHRAYAEGKAPLVHDLAAIGQRCAHIVERGLAQIARPPELRVFQ